MDDAQWEHFKARLRVANLLRLQAMTTADEDEANALHETASRVVEELREVQGDD
jgi:hypothetical protein